MTLFDIIFLAVVVGITGSAIAYIRHVVRSNAFERPTEEQIKHMIDTAPPKEEDDGSAT